MASKRVHECQNCGAALDIPEKHDRFFTCKYCGSVHEDTSSDSERSVGNLHITITPQPPVDLGHIPAYGKPRRGRGAMVGLVIMLIVTGGITAAVVALVVDTDELGQQGSGGGLTIYNYAQAVPVASDDQTGADVVAIARTPADDPVILYVDFDADDPIRWQSEQPLESDTLVLFAFTDSLVILNDEDTVFALNRQSGAEAWRLKLSDKVESTICTDCVRVIGDALVTLTADGRLAAHSTNGGEELWSEMLRATPRQIVDLGGNPAALDETDDGVKLRVFALADGSLVGESPITCDQGFPSIYETLFPAPGRTALYLSDDDCALRIATDDTDAWKVPYEYAGFPEPEPEQVLVGVSHVLIGAEGAVEVMDLANGEVRRIADADGLVDRELYPIGLSTDPANVAVFAAKATRGTATWSIMAVDLGAGNVKWEFSIEASASMALDRSFAVDDGWTAALTSAGVTVAQRLDDGDELLVQTIGIGNGTASSTQAIDIPNTNAAVNWLSHYGWNGDRLLMAADGGLLVIDGPTAEVVAQAP